MGRGQNITGVWEKLILTFTDDFEGFKTPLEEVIEEAVEIVRKPEVQVDSEDVTVRLPYHDNILTDEWFLLLDEQRK